MKSINSTIIFIICIILLIFVSGCRNNEKAEIEELKAAFELTVILYNSGDIDEYFANIHDNVVYCVPYGKSPVEGKPAVRNMYDNMLSELDSAHWESINPKFIVIGTTGIVWGTFKHTTKSKDQSIGIFSGQDTEIFTKTKGKWLKIFEHISHFPEEVSQSD